MRVQIEDCWHLEEETSTWIIQTTTQYSISVKP
jgi:hypothetical protein